MILHIFSWNVNGLRAVERKGALNHFLTAYHPDILFLQEIKGTPTQFSADLTAHPTYAQFYHSAQKPGYAGTGIWIRRAILAHATDVRFITDVPDLVASDEGRVAHLACRFGGVPYDFFSIYFPNGGKSPLAWKEKLIFYRRMLAHVTSLHDAGHRVVWGGDVNVAHRPIDLARPRENDGKIGFHPDERAWMDHVCLSGWVDTWRTAYPEKSDGYTWWDPVTRARTRNVGWRIDYLFVHQSLAASTKHPEIYANVTGSDHCPIGLTLHIPIEV